MAGPAYDPPPVRRLAADLEASGLPLGLSLCGAGGGGFMAVRLLHGLCVPEQGLLIS